MEGGGADAREVDVDGHADVDHAHLHPNAPREHSPGSTPLSHRLRAHATLTREERCGRNLERSGESTLAMLGVTVEGNAEPARPNPIGGQCPPAAQDLLQVFLR